MLLYMKVYRTAPLLRPPFLRPTSRKKREGGRNNEDLRFRLAVNPPPPSPTFAYCHYTTFAYYTSLEINWELCCAVEEEISFNQHECCWPSSGHTENWQE